jgi:hypothetical protein
MNIYLIIVGLILAFSVAPRVANAETIAIESGQVERSHTGMIWVYEGIPYEAPPVGPFAGARRSLHRNGRAYERPVSGARRRLASVSNFRPS